MQTIIQSRTGEAVTAISVRVPIETRQDIKVLAAQKGWSMNTLVSYALKEFLETEQSANA